MAASKRRFDKIAESLTPMQAVIASIEEANQLESFTEYALWLGERLKDPENVRTLIKRVEIGIRHRMQGEAPEKVQKAVLDAMRETSFLDSLQLRVNAFFVEERLRMDLCGKLLLERACTSFGEAIKGPLDLDLDIHSEETLGSHAIEVFTFEAAIQRIGKQYYENHKILLKYYDQQLQQFIQRIDDIRDRWQWVSYFEYRHYHPGKERRFSDCRLPLNLKKLKRSIDPTELIKWLVDWAHADTLQLMGDRRAALKLIVSMVDPLTRKVRASTAS